MRISDWSSDVCSSDLQLRFGRAKWLEPATDATLAALPASGVTRVAIVAPGFSADCLETLEELAIRGRETFRAAGGTDFAYLPCLNDSAVGIALLKTLLARELDGWAGPARSEENKSAPQALMR